MDSRKFLIYDESQANRKGRQWESGSPLRSEGMKALDLWAGPIRRKAGSLARGFFVVLTLQAPDLGKLIRRTAVATSVEGFEKFP